MNEMQLRERICRLGRSLFERGLTNGSSGNLSAKTDGGFLMTPTNSCLGELDPASLSKIDASGALLAGDPPTKEYPFHLAFYQKQADVGAVVHLHSTYCTALSCLEFDDPVNPLPAYTPYFLMRIGRLALVPYHMPGSDELAAAVSQAASDHRAVLMANHGPIVAGASIDKAVYAMEELEETARLFFILRGMPARELDAKAIQALKAKFNS